jgi:hypothetical protein
LMKRLDQNPGFIGWLAFWDVLALYGALALLWLSVRWFDTHLGRVSERADRLPWIADVVAVLAGAITVVFAAGAIVFWARGFALESLTLNEVFMICWGVAVVMTGLMMLTAVVTFDVSVERATPGATIRTHWWRTFRLALLLAVGPGLIALAMATAGADSRVAEMPGLSEAFPGLLRPTVGNRLIIAVLVVATILAQGAATTAVSLAFRVWTNREGLAAALGLGFFLGVTLIWTPLVLSFDPSRAAGGPSQFVAGLSMMSFLLATATLVAQLVMHQPVVVGVAGWAAAWVVLLSLFTIGILWLTSRTVTKRQLDRTYTDGRPPWYAKCLTLAHATRSTPLPAD